MRLTAITRDVSPSLNHCELSFYERQPIDIAKATEQHHAYRECLAELGASVISLPAEPELPDAVFVEDAALVLDELAIMTNMGAPSRRREVDTLAPVLARYRPLRFLTAPATLDGGDVLRAGRTLFVGSSGRTNREGIEQLRELLEPYDYIVQPVAVRGCLHFKSACSYLGDGTILLNRWWIDPEPLQEFQLLDVPAEEPAAANALLLNDVVILPASFPKTKALLARHGFRLRTVDISELQKAEAGVTCSSLIFNTRDGAD